MPLNQLVRNGSQPTLSNQGDDHRLLQSIHPQNLLSYGNEAEPIPLNALNILIGPNGSGKSNLLETIAALRSTATDLRSVISRGGGVSEWVWKGNPHEVASIEAVVTNPLVPQQPLRHVLRFRAENQVLSFEDERIENEKPYPGKPEPYFYYRYQNGQPILNVAGDVRRQLKRENHEWDSSILAQLRDPEAYPEISYLENVYKRIRIYREWSFGRSSVFRVPQMADSRSDRLEEDFSNLAMFLVKLRRQPQTKNKIATALRDLYGGLTDFEINVEGGTVQVFFSEGDFSIPASRLSDGSLRYLCLLAILCDPEPPPLICIEEPELGLHPDLIHKVADLLIEASRRTQLIVTTHSDILVDAMTDRPESVLVFSKVEGQSIVDRLNPQELSHWLERYRLGQLWTMGQLGGTRW